MKETLLRDGDVLVRQHGALRRLTLNRPQALNALTLGMAVTMTEYLRAWAEDGSVGAVVIDGAGARGFCAGGDLRALYDAAKSGEPLPQNFWATEYRLDVLIARYRKPVIAIMDGTVMGGGVGLSAHAAHRVVTERSAIAMPEVAIGYFPDVGASYLLARAPGCVGMHLALTGERIGAADAIFCGLADIHIPAERLAEVLSALVDCHTAAEVRARLERLAAPAAPGKLPGAQAWIDVCYGAGEIEEILRRLHASSGEAAHAALAMLQRMSPTALKIALRNVRSARSFNKVEQSFQQDYRISLKCIAAHDFIEGIRAAIVDKDRKPAWRPDKLEHVTSASVDEYFRTVGALELEFEH